MEQKPHFSPGRGLKPEPHDWQSSVLNTRLPSASTHNWGVNSVNMSHLICVKNDWQHRGQSLGNREVTTPQIL